MELLPWLQKKLGRRTRLADDVGVTPQYIDYVARRKRRPNPDLAAAISAATGGEVTVEEILFPAGLPEGAVLASPVQVQEVG
jgi:DNA-binding transcriptional regulator YdaS (Cro superfamily)